MQLHHPSRERANVLLCVIGTILIVSVIGGNILLNCVTRFNAASGQVRGWKESLYAAEAGGDLAYAEVRKTILDPTHAFTSWTHAGSTYTSTPVTFGADGLSTSAAADIFYYDTITGNAWYRLRVKGTAPLQGLKRVGMDDRMGVGTRGDSMLRKIDFNYDHFIAAYGASGDGTGKAVVPVSKPSVSRRIELISAPVTPFEAAIKCSGSFYGLGSAAQIDSYNSKNGAYYFCATSPSDPHYSDSRSGSVEIGSSTATVMGMLYGNLATNGGTVTRSSYVTGTIDNNVPFTIPPYRMPTNFPAPQPSPTSIPGTVSLTPPTPGSPSAPTYYLLSSLSGKLTVNPSGSAETYVAIHVTNDMTASIDVKPQVHLKIFFDGNMTVKARDIINESGVAANLQYYGISPSDPSTSQTIAIAPPGNFAATFYAPSADVSLTGNPDITGALVSKTFYGNGNTSWHYDRELDTEGDAVDYRITSYVEDTR